MVWCKGQTAWNKGKPPTEEHRKHMIENHVGMTGKFGGKRDSAQRKKMSDAQRERFRKNPVSQEMKNLMQQKSKSFWEKEEHKKEHSLRMRGRKVDEQTKKKISQTLLGHPGSLKGKKQSEETRRKVSVGVSKAILEGRWKSPNYGINGRFFSKKGFCVWYRSLLERDWFVVFDEDVDILKWCVEPVAIPYMWNEKVHLYHPDVEIIYLDGVRELLEIKPEFQWTDPQNLAKWDAAQEWCKKQENSIIFSVIGYDALKKRQLEMEKGI
jgi:hypothetical protein